MFQLYARYTGTALSLVFLCLYAANVSAQHDTPFKRDLIRAEKLLYQDVSQADALFKTLKPLSNSGHEFERYLLLEVRILGYQGQSELAYNRLSTLLELSLSPNNQSAAYYLQARVYQLKHQYDKAFEYLSFAAQIPQEQVSIFNQIQILSLAGELKMEDNNASEALYFSMKAITMADLEGNTFERCFAYESIVYIYARQNVSDKFEQTSAKAIELCEMANAHILLVNLYAGHAVFYQKNNNHQLQLDIAVKLVALLDNSFDIVNKLQIQLILLDAYLGLELWDLADDLLQAIGNDTAITKRDSELGELARIGAEVSIGLGNTKQALEQYKQYVSWQEANSVRIRGASYQYNSVEFNHAIAKNLTTLNQRTQTINLLKQRNDEYVFVIATLLAGFAVLLVFIVIYIYRSGHQITTVVDRKVDSLTNLYFYRHCFDYSMSQKSLIYNPNKQYAVLLIDIDSFASFNDNFGHDQGDLLLKTFAMRLKDYFHDYGVIVRQRDDRFIALLANCSHRQVNNISHQALMLLADYRYQKTNPELGINIGWYYHSEVDVCLASQFDYGVACANQALEQGKKLMRGCAVEYTTGDNDGLELVLKRREDRSLHITIP